MSISYHNRRFRSVANSAGGDVSGETEFHYREDGSTIWGTYRGGAIASGTLIGTRLEDGRLTFHYQHLTHDGTFKAGHCTSTPQVMDDGRIRLREAWTWTHGGAGSGVSDVEEVRVAGVLSNPAGDATDSATAYTAALLDLLGHREPLDVLRETPAALERAIAGLSDAQLRRPEREGAWSIVHVVQHLADSETVWAWRLRLVLAHERPPIQGYDQNRWSERLHYPAADPQEALATFATLRRGNLRLLALASPDDLARVGVHAERGEESVEHMVRLYAGHDLAHLRQISRVRSVVA